MKITRYITALSAIIFALLVASPALASSPIHDTANTDNHSSLHLNSKLNHDGGKNNRNANDKSIVTIPGTVSAIRGSTLTLTGRNGTIYTIDTVSTTISNRDTAITLGDITVGDMLVVKGTLSGSVITAAKIHDTSFAKRAFISAIGATGAGVVTSVTGSTFTMTPYATEGTTTVTTNASTIYKVNGVATTSSALQVDSRAIIYGTVTSPTSITATMVSILSNGFGFFKHFFH